MNELKWSLPRLDRVAIAYTTEDRFWSEDDDDDVRLGQRVRGEVVGESYDTDAKIPLGTLTLTRIELLEVGDLYGLLDHDSDWYPFTRLHLGEEADATRGMGMLTSFLLILERVRIVPEARGYGLGLHVLARAIRTWGVGEGIVGLIAGAYEDEERTREAGEALAAYWLRLGFTRLEDGPDRDPLLFQTTESADFAQTLKRHSKWVCPT